MTRRYNKYENYLSFIGEDKSSEEFGDFLILMQRKKLQSSDPYPDLFDNFIFF